MPYIDYPVVPYIDNTPHTRIHYRYDMAGGGGDDDDSGEDGEVSIGYDNDTNPYEMATTTNFPLKPSRHAKTKAAGYSSQTNDYEMASGLEGAGGLVFDPDDAAMLGEDGAPLPMTSSELNEDFEPMPEIAGAHTVIVSAATVAEAHSRNDAYTPEHPGQQYVESLGLVVGTEGGAAGEAANADEGTVVGVYITGIRAAAASGSVQGLATGQRILAVNGVNMMSESLASVLSVLGGTVVFATIGMATDIELLVLDDPEGFEGIPADTKVAASAVAEAAAFGGGNLKRAESLKGSKDPAGVWLKKKAEGIGRSKKRYVR